MTDLKVCAISEGAKSGYAVFENGKRISYISNSRAYAMTAMEAEERRRQRKKRKTRACLCCGKDFSSQGNHNRLCDSCRKRPDDGGDYTVCTP